jgi:PAS domain S-box-containing protein
VLRETLFHTQDLPHSREQFEHEVRRRQTAESTLRESEARYRLLYDNNPSMYFTLSPEGTVLSVNQFGATQLGYQPHELIDRSVLTVFRPEDHQTVLGQLIACAATPLNVFEWEIQKIRKDGSLLWVKERAQAVQDHTGRMLVLVVCEDISERLLTEEHIRESEERWRAFYEYAGVGIAQLDLTGQFLRVNPRLCETLGYSSKTLLQRTFQELTHPADLEPNLEHFKKLVAGTLSSFSMEKRYRRSDDTWVWVNLTVSLVRTASSAPAYFIAVVEDSSERKRSEEALRKSEEAIRSLHEATSTPGLTFEERLQTVLELGCRRFKIPIGVFTKVAGDELKVSQVYGPTGALTAGIQVPLCQTYCSAALRTDGPLSFEHASASEWRHHPGYAALGLECYIGTKLSGQHKVYGTICFMGPDPYPGTFSEADKDFLLLMARWISGELDRQEAEQRLNKINECFLGFGTDPLANINRLTALCGELLVATCALYSRLEGELLSSIGQWQAPPNFNPVDKAEGHLCCDLIHHGKDDVSTVRHLASTSYAKTDPNVSRYRLQTYVGKIVKRGKEAVGSLCVVFQHDVIPTEADERLMSILASAIGTEEERLWAQKALRVSEERFAIAFRSSPHPVIMTDLMTGRCLEVNDASLKLFGYRREEVLGQTTIALGLWPTPDDRAQFFQQLQAEGTVKNREISLRAKDGSPRQLLVSSEIIELNGNPCLITVGNDVTEHKQAEAALRESEERFAKAFRASPYPMVISEIDSGLCLDANDAAIHLFGYRREEVTGRTVDELGLWPTPDYRRRFILRMKERGAIWNAETPLRKKNGEFRTCMISAEQIELNGKHCMVTIGLDVTEQKQAEAALRASELQLQRFVSEAPVGLVIVDAKRQLLSANKAFCALTGYAEEEVLNNTYALYTHPDDLPENLKLTDEFFSGKRTSYTYEKRYIRKQGNVIWVSVKTTPIELPNHPGPLLLAVVQDITERKQATEAKERLSQDLHDNLLQSLYAIGMQLEAGKLVAARSAKQSKLRMTQAIAQLNDLVRDVRQFIALLKQDTAPVMDFRQALQKLADSFSTSNQVNLELHIDQEAIQQVTPVQAEQLLNIAREALSNSVRHARASRQAVRLTTEGRLITMQICDDGIGFRASQKRHRGHGLANMAARAKTIRARFTLDSRPRKGTCITVELPLEEPHERA